MHINGLYVFIPSVIVLMWIGKPITAFFLMCRDFEREDPEEKTQMKYFGIFIVGLVCLLPFIPSILRAFSKVTGGGL